ncbi:MAG: carboxypeptidase-like regulatory domain-containing protein [Flavobacteriales bacterium]|nr:carboxypeptidase-like regulatory domain-containing protein [Flavobacteriales bacterium]MDG1779944.1 carboxypeptidase-like regulatory domain-containing protein [Flavobacteriales bacterium]MDG2245738.1 carboxypeptidase-like regulatory domain-containing protein [Flavobacteriales bacterium]
MRNLLLLVALATSLSVLGQQDSLQKVVQFSGVVVTGDSLNPVPFTTVYRERDQRGTITDSYGFFSIPTFVGDTIRFSCIGYMKSDYVIPDSLPDDRYNIVQILGRDTIQVSTTFVYPYPTKERFRQEFLALDLAQSKDELAEKNLEAALLYERMQESGMSASENYRYAVQQQSRQISYAGQMPTISLLNPIAWAQFIQAWKNGSFKKQ